MDLSKDSVLFESNILKHILTHQEIYSRAYFINVTNDDQWKYLKEKYNLISYNKEEVENIPKPVLISKHLMDLAF